MCIYVWPAMADLWWLWLPCPAAHDCMYRRVQIYMYAHMHYSLRIYTYVRQIELCVFNTMCVWYCIYVYDKPIALNTVYMQGLSRALHMLTDYACTICIILSMCWSHACLCHKWLGIAELNSTHSLKCLALHDVYYFWCPFILTCVRGIII